MEDPPINTHFLFEFKTLISNNLKIDPKMKVLIAGGDGFIGWPFALRMSKDGWDVLIVDNLSRRKIDD